MLSWGKDADRDHMAESKHGLWLLAEEWAERTFKQWELWDWLFLAAIIPLAVGSVLAFAELFRP